MCYFLTVGIKQPYAQTLLTKLQKDIESEPNENLSVRQILPADYAPIYITLNGCSCDLYDKTEGLHSNLKHWLQTVVEEVKDAYILLHWYSGFTDSEKISISDHTYIPDDTLIYVIKE